MDGVNRTLYIPLYGKALVSRRGLLLRDEKAEAIWEQSGFALKGRAASAYLAYYMGMRAAVFDDWVRARLAESDDAVVLHLGCGLDSRCLRVASSCLWYDVDLPAVITERRKWYEECSRCHMVSADLRRKDWLEQIPPAPRAIVVLEGVSMYLQSAERRALLRALTERFGKVQVLMDVYSVFAAKASRYRNPINTVGVTEVYGLDDPREPEQDTQLRFLARRDMTPPHLVDTLPARERVVFRRLYAGKMASKLYRLYEYESGTW